jgi:tetratricopeptide (TPR) repeat protein
MAWLCRAQGKREEAEGYARACEELAERINSERLRISALILRSIFALDDQRLDEGLELQRAAAKRAEQAGDDAQTQSANANLIVCLLIRGQFVEAETCAAKAEALAVKANNLDMQAFVLVKHGLTYCQRRDYRKACELMTQGAELARRIGAWRRLLEALGDLTLAQIGAGRFDECERRLAEAANLAQDVATWRDARSFEIKAALLSRGRGQYAQAVELWRALEATAQDEFARVEAGVEVALSLALLGRIEEAERQLADLAPLRATQSEFLIGGFNVARGLCEAARGHNNKEAGEAFGFALKQLNPPVDDCMHDVLLAHAGLALGAADAKAAREAARAGLAEVKRRGIGNDFPSPHLRQACAALRKLSS